MDINQKLLNALITRHIDLMRYETSVRAEVFAKMDEMQDDVWGFVLSGSLKKVEHIITQGYELLLKMWDVLPVFSAEMAWLSATLGGLAVAYKLKDKIVPFAQNKLKDLVDKFTIGGLTLPESVAKQRDDLVRKLKQIVRFAKIDDVLPSSDDVQAEFDRAKSSLKTLSKTWINSAVHTAHDAFAKVNPMIKGFRHVSTLDGKTSSVCTHRNGLLWDKKHKPIGHAETFKRPPLHPNCRSKLVYVYDLDKPFDGMTGADWVKSRSLKQLQDQFGVGIGKMLFDGEIDLADALDGLRPLTLKQLQDKTRTINLQKWMGLRRYHLILNDLQQDKAVQQKIKAYGLTEAESVVLRYYTGAGYRELNGFLRGAFADVDLSKVADLMRSALNKLPDYQGIVIRRDNLPSAILLQHELGNVVAYPAFTSATFGTKDVVIGREMPHRLIIHAKHAKKIDWISEISDELEVVFTSPTQFEIKNIKLNQQTGVLEIKLDEW